MNKNLIYTVSDEQLLEKLKTECFTFYFGIDPTAEGIHLGHLLSIKLCLDLIETGHKGIILIGGFTASIGDPTGKSETRKVITEKDASTFSEGILRDVKNIFKDSVQYVNNKEWLETKTLKDFVEFSRQISVNKKLTLETFSKRIEEENHLSASEFLYPELQLMDFIYLNEMYGCNLQIGGGDQWGNMSFGVHYLNKKTNVYAIATPLLTDGGKKISKTDSKTPFLKEYRDMYHYCLKMNDLMAENICHIFQIKILPDPIQNKKNIFKFIYSIYLVDTPFETIEERESQLFYGNINDISQENFIKTKEKNLIEIISSIIQVSKSEAKRKIEQNAIYIDGKQVKDISLPQRFKLSIGKKKHFFVEIV